MRLYHSPMSISLACRLALAATDADVEIVVVKTGENEHLQEPFLTINPLAEVPVLEYDGVVLTQTVAILSFIAEQTGQGWTQASAIARAKALSIMVLTSVEVQGNWKMNNKPERFADCAAGRAEVVQHARLRLDKAYSEIERQLELFDDGAEMGILDYYLCVFALWKIMIPIASEFAPTPRLEALRERVMSSPKLKQVIDDDIAVYTARVAAAAAQGQ